MCEKFFLRFFSKQMMYFFVILGLFLWGCGPRSIDEGSVKPVISRARITARPINRLPTGIPTTASTLLPLDPTLVDLSRIEPSEWMRVVANTLRDILTRTRASADVWQIYGGDIAARRIPPHHNGDLGPFQALAALWGELTFRAPQTSPLAPYCLINERELSVSIWRHHTTSWHPIERNIPDNLHLHRSVVAAPFAKLDKVCANLLTDFRVKQVVLAHRLLRFSHANSDAGGALFEQVRRPNVGVLLATIMDMSPRRIRNGIKVRYSDEPSVGDGVKRDWMLNTVRSITAQDENLLWIDPNDSLGLTRVHERFEEGQPDNFRAIGRVLAISLVEGIPLGFRLNPSVYQYILGKRDGWTLDDLRDNDPQAFSVLSRISTCNDRHDCGDYFGGLMDFGAPDGSAYDARSTTGDTVEAHNAEDFIRLTSEWYLFKRWEAAYAQLSQGLYDVIPSELIQGLLGPRDLASFLQGEVTVTIEDLRASTEYSSYSDKSPQVLWLWKFLEEGGQERKLQFIRFVSGLVALPVGGLAALGKRFQITHMTYDATRPFPTAQTCFYKFRLPEYPSKTVLERWVGNAIQTTDLTLE